ncbi:MAG: heme-binding protein [Thermoplasmata archaeon]|nr:MAG: heme-binding protein [Thermoplasmata archaeon]
MVKKVQYEVLDKIGDIEIRKYPELVLASVYGKDDNTAFRILFSYITGNNQSGKNIAMTAPVVSSGQTEDASLVISSEDFFTFVMPADYDLDRLPEPRDKRIDIHVQQEKIFAVLRFSGRTTKQKVKQKENELLKLLSQNNYKMRGKPFLMRYNNPIMPGFLRTNEVGIEVIL